MTEQDARNALRGLGITPTPQLIENWLRAESAEAADLGPGAQTARPSAWRSQPEEEEWPQPDLRQQPSSKSRLEPILRESGQLERQAGPCKPGRPLIVAGWFEKVAETMADGTSLKTALSMNGLSLSRSEVRACYRNKTLRAMYQETRRRYLAEHYGRRPTLRAKFGCYM